MEEVGRKERREEMRIRLQGAGVGMWGRSTPCRDLRGEGSQTDQSEPMPPTPTSSPAAAFCLRLSATAAEDHDDHVFSFTADIHTRARFTFVSFFLRSGPSNDT